MSAGNLFPSYFGSGLRDLNNGISAYHSIFFFLFFSIYCFFTILTLIFSAELENGSRGITSQTPDEFSCKYWTLEINCWFPAQGGQVVEPIQGASPQNQFPESISNFAASEELSSEGSKLIPSLPSAALQQGCLTLSTASSEWKHQHKFLKVVNR